MVQLSVTAALTPATPASFALGRPAHGPADRLSWYENRLPHGGDANRNGRFDSAVLVLVFQEGEYEDSIVGNSLWEEGDWNGDGNFDSSDLVLAFQTGLYEQ